MPDALLALAFRGNFYPRIACRDVCGIAGFIADPARATSSDQLKSIANAMDFALEHRGPDDHNVWIDGEAGVALVHRRLSIVDLSAASGEHDMFALFDPSPQRSKIPVRMYNLSEGLPISAFSDVALEIGNVGIGRLNVARLHRQQFFYRSPAELLLQQ